MPVVLYLESATMDAQTKVLLAVVPIRIVALIVVSSVCLCRLVRDLTSLVTLPAHH